MPRGWLVPEPIHDCGMVIARLSRQLNIHLGESMAPVVSISKLFAILIAAAMLFTPFAMQSGSAMAAMPSDHYSEMMSKDHCEGQPTTDKDSKSADKPCCASMCSASTLPAQARPNEVEFSRLLAVPGTVTLYRGVASEISTPPPRVS